MKTVRFFLGALLALAGACALAVDFTPAERRQVEQIRGMVESSCKKQMESKLLEALPDNPPVAVKWLSELSLSSDFCSCSADAFAKRVTPQLLRSGSEKEGVALGKAAGVECMLPKFKSTFPNFCRGLMGELAKNAVNDVSGEESFGKFCECVQPDIEAIDQDSFEPFMNATMQDFAEVKRTRVMPTGNRPSLATSMRRCGIEDLRAKAGLPPR